MNSDVQVADLNTAYFQPQEKSKQSKHRENYHRDYYLKNREKFLAYSREYYGVKKLLAPYLNEEKKEKERDQKEREKIVKREEKVLNNFFSSHTRSSLTIARKDKELVFFLGGGVKELGSSKEKLERRLDQKKIRLATQDKRPVKKGWTYGNWQEWLSKERLLGKYEEWSIRGGQRLGNKFLSFLDIDIEKEDLKEWRKRQLRKNVRLLLNYLGCFYVETKKGYHVYLLTDELLPNSLLYHTDKFGKKRIIGSIQSKGKYVVGFDSKDKKLMEKGRWFWHGKDLGEVKEKLGKFFIETGNKEQNIENKFLELQQELRKKQTEQVVPLSHLNQNINYGQLRRQAKSNIQAKILSKYKTPLPHLWKAFYLNWKTKQTGYFLINDYQREQAFSNLEIGRTRNVCLIQGYKHPFLSRLC